MDTLKTAAVVIVLLGALYGVYVVLNKPETIARFLPAAGEKETPPEVNPPRIDTGTPVIPERVESDGGGAATSTHPAPSPRSSYVADSGARSSDGGAYADDPGSGLQPRASSDPYDRTWPSDPRADDVRPRPEEGGSSAPPLPPDGGVRTDIHYELDASWQAAERLIEQGKLRDALAELTKYYDHPDLREAEQQRLLDWVDALAGEVIYSKRHLLEPRFAVEPGDTLERIADAYEVPPQLLANINGIDIRERLLPDTVLKVVRGPFSAEVDVSRQKLTLFLNTPQGVLYAGRFPISAGDELPAPGTYLVKFKDRGAPYYQRDGRTIAKGLPENPYGDYWIDLGSGASLHGSPASATAAAGWGCISLSPRDAADVYGILTAGSQVTIRR